MSNLKNKITNILGVLIWYISYDSYNNGESLAFIITFLIIGLALFLFKASDTLIYIKKALNKILGVNNSNSSKTVDPDRENPDTRG